jgi:hypothetical protein
MRKKLIAPEKPATETVTPQPEAVAMPVPLPEPPAVLALQDDIVGLVRQRSAIQMRLAELTAKSIRAQAEAQAAQSELSSVDGEVQYRLGIIRQMRGEAPPLQYGGGTAAAYALDIRGDMFNHGLAGISSEPAPVRIAAPAESEDGVNRGHASRAML